MSFLAPKTPKPPPLFSSPLVGTAFEETGSQRRHATRMRIGRRGSTILTDTSLAKPIGEGTGMREGGRPAATQQPQPKKKEGTETREEGRQTARTREGRRGSTILTGASLAKPIDEETGTREGERPAATQQPQPKKKEGTGKREEERQDKPDPCQVIVDAEIREFNELIRVRQAIHPARAAIDAKEQEIEQLEKLRPGDKIPGEETPAKKEPAVPPLPIPSLPRIGKRRLPPTGILGLVLEMERKLKEMDEFNRKRGVSVEKLKAELKELEKQLENLIHQERNLKANVALLSERLRKCRAENG